MTDEGKPLTVDNLLAALDELREMASKEGKRITLEPPLYIDVEETYKRWMKARNEHPR
jgi:hypothetical protein